MENTTSLVYLLLPMVLTAEKNGYETKTVTGVNINADETTTLSIVLEKEKKKREEKSFIPGFETPYLLAGIGVCTLLLKRKKLCKDGLNVVKNA